MWRPGGRDAAGARLRRGLKGREGNHDLHGRNGFPASGAPRGMARLVSGAYPGAAERAGFPRFEALLPAPAPYLALHEVSGPEMFQSAAYRDRGGPASTGEWRELQTNWRRNLLKGVDATPDVPADCHVLLLDGARDVMVPPGI